MTDERTVSADLVTEPATVTARMVIHSPLPWFPDHPLLTLIGRVTAGWAQLESLLDEMITEQASYDPQMIACFTGQMMGHSPRINTIGALARWWGMSDEVIREIAKFGDRVFALANDRNRLTHDAWFTADADGEPAQKRMMPRGSWKFGLEPASAKDVEALIAKIGTLVDKANELRVVLDRERDRIRAERLAARQPQPA